MKDERGFKDMRISGIQSGMVMQRDIQTDTCSVFLTIENAVNPSVSLGELKQIEKEKWALIGIPTGGPYELTFFDDKTKVCYTDIWVGDVWILGGQSNMQGVGALRDCDRTYDLSPQPQVRAYYLDDHWGAAISQLHQLWTFTETPLAEKALIQSGYSLADREKMTLESCGVGPGLFIGKYLYEKTGVPQGLIACAFGGTCMNDWMPENTTPTSMYQTMLRRFYACGGNVRGMFWYQGESDLNWMCNIAFTDNMVKFVSALRKDFGIPELPFVQAQLNQCQDFGHVTLDRLASWMKIQEQQRKMEKQISNFSTVSTANAYREDLIHINTDSQEALGQTFAMEMLALLGEKSLCTPKLCSVEVRPAEGHLANGRNMIVLTYDHVIGELTSDGNPYGYSITLVDEIPYLFPYKGIDHICMSGNQVRIVTQYSAEQLQHGYIWYGAGPNVVCNIHDSEGRAPLVMGPVPIAFTEEI